MASAGAQHALLAAIDGRGADAAERAHNIAMAKVGVGQASKFVFTERGGNCTAASA